MASVSASNSTCQGKLGGGGVVSDINNSALEYRDKETAKTNVAFLPQPLVLQWETLLRCKPLRRDILAK